MAITDAERHRLHTKLDQVLGEEDAAVLISHLPPSGWSDVVRTRDLDQLAAHVDDRFATLEARIDDRLATLEARVDDRFAVVEARFDVCLERVMREQTNRFLAYTAAIVTIAATLQQLLG